MYQPVTREPYITGFLSTLTATLLVLAGLTSGCSQANPKSASTSPATQESPTIYEVRGVIRDIAQAEKEVTIAHEEIPDYMEAMTMMLVVKDRRELDGLKVGDTVSFRMLVTEDDGWIDQIKKIDDPVNVHPPEPEELRRVREVEQLAIGDLVPEYTFTNTLGRAVKLSDYRGKAVAMTFIFTRCPFPTFCPRLANLFKETQQQLKKLPSAPTNWQLLSITIDPAYDTPERLKAYAKQNGADPERWDYLTGDLMEITAITEQFAFQFWRPTPDALPSHNLRTVVLDATGRVQWISIQNDWKPATLVEQLVKAAKASGEP
jgi:protein SCO1/2